MPLPLLPIGLAAAGLWVFNKVRHPTPIPAPSPEPVAPVAPSPAVPSSVVPSPAPLIARLGVQTASGGFVPPRYSAILTGAAAPRPEDSSGSLRRTNLNGLDAIDWAQARSFLLPVAVVGALYLIVNKGGVSLSGLHTRRKRRRRR